MKKTDEPARDQAVVRFGCGGLLGLVMGGRIAIHFWKDGHPLKSLLFIGVVVVALGTISRLMGDRFWQKLADWTRLGGGP